MLLARIALNRFPTVAAKCAKTLGICDGGICKNVGNARNAHTFYYRTASEPSKCVGLLADGINGFMWWWILWHLATEPGHVFGEWPYTDPSKWTDEELGIPPKSPRRLRVEQEYDGN